MECALFGRITSLPARFLFAEMHDPIKSQKEKHLAPPFHQQFVGSVVRRRHQSIGRVSWQKGGARIHACQHFLAVTNCEAGLGSSNVADRAESKHASPSFLPGRHQSVPPPGDQRVSYPPLQGLSTFPPERLQNKVVMVRCDWNVEIGVHEIKGILFKDKSKLVASLPTIRHLVGGGARVVVVSEFGTPQKGQRLQHSLRVLSEQLCLELGQDVMMATDCIEDAVDRAIDELKPGQILVLENLRFYKEEKANDLAFAQKLASKVDIFVNDALGPCSQASASASGVPVFVGRRIAGLQLEKELRYLNQLTSQPARPLVAIVGGGKLSTRYALLKSLITHQKSDRILLGAGLSSAFLHALGWRTGGSVIEPGSLKLAKELLQLAEREGVEIVLPVDVVCGEAHGKSSKVKICSARHVLLDWAAFDIGPQTIDLYAFILEQAKTVFWIGAVGSFDRKAFKNGTLSLAETLSDLTRAERCVSIVHGKDIERALKTVRGKASHVCLGGSSAVTLLTGAQLPGLAALDEVPTCPPDWAAVYCDPTAPLTVDVGCGDGGFLLQLSAKQSGNLLGLDLFGHLVDAANARALRDGRSNLHYLAANATTSLGPIFTTYPGPLKLVTVQCPTPQFEARGLGRLVLRQPLVEAIVENLVPGGQLFIQSDVEEVATSMVGEIQKHGQGMLRIDGSCAEEEADSHEQLVGLWLPDNPFGLPTQWEVHAMSQGRNMFRLMYRKQ